MDGDLLDEWIVPAPHRCGSCAAIEQRAKSDQRDYTEPGSLRYLVMLRHGWQDRKAAAVAKRAAATSGD